MKSVISINGNVTNLADGKIPAGNRMFLYGDGIIETIATIHGNPLNLQDHFDRLRNSCSALRFEMPWSDRELEFEIKNLAELTNADKAVIRISVTRGDGFRMIPDTELNPTKIITAQPAQVEPDSVREQGVSAMMKKLSYTLRDPQLKLPNYALGIATMTQARSGGFDEVIWQNSEGEITEGLTANVFFIGREGDQVEIATPPENCGILPGITRKNLMELLNSDRIPVTVRTIYAEEIPRFDEAFLTSSVRGMIPIKSLGKHTFFTDRPQSTFRLLRRHYENFMCKQVGFRFDWNTGRKIHERSEI